MKRRFIDAIQGLCLGACSLLGLGVAPLQAQTPAQVSSVDECVVLLHGLGRSAWSMKPLERAVSDAGYRVVNQGYDSTALTIEQVAGQVVPDAVRGCGPEAKKTHFVTHSLGGIVVRYFLQDSRLRPGSRIVMLSPPNQGSEVADRFGDAAWYRWFTGPAGQQLTTEVDSIPNRLAPIPYDIGIITGRKSLDPWFSDVIPGADDGKVSVERARLEGMKDFLVVDENHTFIMRSQPVIEQVMRFLHSGRFDHGAG